MAYYLSVHWENRHGREIRKGSLLLEYENFLLLALLSLYPLVTCSIVIPSWEMFPGIFYS